MEATVILLAFNWVAVPQWILAALAVIIFFSVTIMVHEGGHFLAARLLGLRADVFALGFGPAIWKKQIGKTEYRINYIPFGGYVSLPQLDPAGMQMIQGDGQEAGEVLQPAVWWKRVIVAFAGPAGNVLFAILLALIIWTLPPVVPETLGFDGAVIGEVEPESDAAKAGLRSGDRILTVADKPVANWGEYRIESHLCAEKEEIALSVSNIFDHATAVINAKLSKNRMGFHTVSGAVEAAVCGVDSVMEGSAAAEAGLKQGDIIRALNGRRIVSNVAVTEFVAACKGEPIKVSYRRDGAEYETELTPRLTEIENEDGTKEERYLMGVRILPVSVSVPQWAQYRAPYDQLKGDCSSIARVLKPLIRPEHKGEAKRIAGSLGGPAMILTSMWMTMFSGLAGALAFVRYLNINLAIMNLLPLPVLDGGHIVFALWRGLFRRELPPKLLNTLVNGFAFLLIALFLFLTCKDFLNIGKLFGIGG